jgi:hypothetical protein
MPPPAHVAFAINSRGTTRIRKTKTKPYRCLSSTMRVKKIGWFFKNHQNLVGSVGFEFKNQRFLEFKFRKIEKNLEKLCKKLYQILRILVENFFFKPWPFCWIKFKLNQKYKNGPIWPTTHVYGIRSPQLGSRVVSSFPIRSGRERSRSRSGMAEIGGGGVKIGRNRAVITGWADKPRGVRQRVDSRRKP